MAKTENMREKIRMAEVMRVTGLTSYRIMRATERGEMVAWSFDGKPTFWDPESVQAFMAGAKYKTNAELVAGANQARRDADKAEGQRKREEGRRNKAEKDRKSEERKKAKVAEQRKKDQEARRKEQEKEAEEHAAEVKKRAGEILELERAQEALVDLTREDQKKAAKKKDRYKADPGDDTYTRHMKEQARKREAGEAPAAAPQPEPETAPEREQVPDPDPVQAMEDLLRKGIPSMGIKGTG